MLGQAPIYNLRETKLSDILDRQHVEIKRRHQELRAAIIEGRGLARIILSSKQLIAVTLLHFKSEEDAMDTSTTGNFSTHKRMHTDLIEYLEVISNDLEQRRINGAMELMKFFEGRMAYHLDVEDVELECNLGLKVM